jgi:nitroreductase
MNYNWKLSRAAGLAGRAHRTEDRMDALTCIMTRRSTRKYEPGDISDQTMEQLLRAAMAAPSAGNAQPWHFVVLRDRAVLDEIPSFHPYAKMVREAAAAILVCGDPSLEKYKGFWVQDCSNASLSILLAAHALGLGAVWVGVYPEADRVEGFRRLLGLPEQIIPLSLLPLGRPGQQAGSVDRFESGRVHRDRW